MERIVERFLHFVQIDSESGEEKDFALHLKTILESLGFDVKFDQAHEAFGGTIGNLIATKKGHTSKKPILLSAHMDTVKPGKNIKPIIKEGMIYSEGETILGGDDKAGIAAIIEGVNQIIEEDLDHPDLELVFTVCEEGGINGGKHLDLNLIKATEGIILDSSKLPGEIIVQSPGQTRIEVTIHGKSAHAGVSPESGISAAQIFAEAVHHMKLLRIDEETTANIGMISGGKGTNVVMEELKVLGEVRSLNLDKMNEQVKHMAFCFEKAAEKFGGQVTFNSELKYPAFNVDPLHELVINTKKVFEEMGISATTTFTGGGSDANALNARNMTMINLGIGEKKAHTTEEHYAVSDLILMSDFVKRWIIK
ncbi:MAG: M20/M25/M40 family metallo-hydrolase [Clostridia bacterium]|nr:M20/M25/M40 family metallo-hydrolase [Clostridia bacterium]